MYRVMVKALGDRGGPVRDRLPANFLVVLCPTVTVRAVVLVINCLLLEP
jgi:hypothetical protein